MTKKYKLNVEQVNLVQEKDFSSFVESVYGQPYRFQQQAGCRSRGTVSFVVPVPAEDVDDSDFCECVYGPKKLGVPFSEWLKGPSEEYEYEFQQYREFYPKFEKLVDDLSKKGLIAPGFYTINIDW